MDKEKRKIEIMKSIENEEEEENVGKMIEGKEIDINIEEKRKWIIMEDFKDGIDEVIIENLREISLDIMKKKEVILKKIGKNVGEG